MLPSVRSRCAEELRGMVSKGNYIRTLTKRTEPVGFAAEAASNRVTSNLEPASYVVESAAEAVGSRHSRIKSSVLTALQSSRSRSAILPNESRRVLSKDVSSSFAPSTTASSNHVANPFARISESDAKRHALWRLTTSLQTIGSPALAEQEAALTKRKEEQRLLLERQLEMENMAVDSAAERYRRLALETAVRGEGSTLPAATQLIKSWYDPLVKSIEAEQEKVRIGEKGIDRRVYGPYLLLLPPEKLAVIILHTTLSVMMKGEKVKRDNFTGLQLESGKAKLVNMVLHLGEMIQAQSSMVMLEKEVKYGKDVERKAEMGGVGNEAMASAVVGKGAGGGDAKKRKGTEVEAIAAKERKRSNKLEALSKDLQNIEDVMEARNKARMLLRKVSMYSSPWRRAALLLSSQDWGLETRSKVGAAALQLLLDSALVTTPGDGPDADPVTEPAFTRSYHYPNQAQHSRYGVIIWHPTIPKLLEDGHAIRESMHPRYMPMLVPPRPWRKYNDGGHLTIQSVVMRGSYSRIGPSPAQLAELKKFEQKAKREGSKGATQVYDALNVLGETRWSMNNPVFKTVTDLWDMGGDTSGLPSRVDLVVPPEPPQMYGMYNIKGSGMFGPTVPYPEMRDYRKTAVKVRQTNSELHSLRCDFEYKVEVGKMLQDETAFYYPHNVDFRGRAYTMHPHLNHLGADVSRGLLQFADPVPLGESGFYWLMVHVANKYANGVDKYPMQGRFDFSEKHLPDIIDSAEHPIHGRQFWKEAEDPFQFLAACREVRDALLAPQLTAFGSRLPVHQDGSCNGLQHYAALGRDAQGGRAVNLVPGDSPADVYTGIADIVRKRVARDAEGLDGVTPQVQEFAQAVLPHVDRKLVKQTVMTSVYGVTFVGARQQIQARLKERNALAEEMRYRAACYAARSTLQGLDEMFTNAREVMDWLGEAASIVATTGDSVRWRTPLGLPVLQPYRRRGRKIVKTILQNFIVEYENDTLPVVKQKQKSAFPPNYVHSIDSSHMMLTALECKQRGLAFAGVHDSFWTHAGTVPIMNEVLRDKFVELHSELLLETLHASLEEDFPAIRGQLPPPPPSGDLDLNLVKQSPYFFS